MKYLIDTNICIHYLQGKEILEDKFKKQIKDYHISRITEVELRYGAYCSKRVEYHLNIVNSFTNKFEIIEINPKIFDIYIKIRFNLRKNVFIVSDFDLLIAATAINNDLTLITENTKDFKNIQGLKIENWMI